MAQTTAVEWFWVHLPENISKEYFDLFEQAKSIEKEQIIDAATWGYLAETGEQYYKEKYKQ